MVIRIRYLEDRGWEDIIKMNIELIEHFELKGAEKSFTRVIIELNNDVLEGLTEDQKEAFIKFYYDQLALANQITESCLNKYIYKLRHPDDFK